METNKYKVAPEQLRRVCDPSVFSFETTAEIAPLTEVFGQDRALRAIEFGVDISSSGYNLFLAGQPGTGKTNILKRLLKEVVKTRPVPDDVFYVHNFEDPDTPRALSLPAGMGCRFQHDMQELVRDLQEMVPKVFEGKEYEEHQQHRADGSQQRKEALFKTLAKQAEELGFEIKSTPAGFQTVPLRDGEPLTQDAFEQLEKEERKKLEARMADIQGKVRDFVSEVKRLDRAYREELRQFNQQVAMNVLGSLMQDLRDRYENHKGLLQYLDNVQQDVLENIDQFRGQEEQMVLPGLRVQGQQPDFTRYMVNLVVDNSGLKGAPVVFETNPTYNNVVGRIEKRAQFGALITDFTMIRAGSLAKANGGFLVLEIEEVLRNPFVYDALKRALQNQEVRIEDPSERFGMLSTQTLRPEPIPLKLKVCLIGRPLYYHLLYSHDEVFRESFKVKADFDHQADRNEEAAVKLGAFVARIVNEEKLAHFHRTAIAAIVDEGSRWVEDQEKISMQFGRVHDLMRQAAHWAKHDGAEVVSASHVERAVDEIEYRSSLTKERVQELIKRDVLSVETAGESPGQINGLAVHMLGDYLFGRPSKITANVHLGSEGVVNIERRVRLSHSTHDKGVLILGGFFGERFAQEQPLTLSASLTFEQSYAEVAGDSASSTELYVLLSALSRLPIRQGIAVSGSVNQKGEVQAVGGINYKIEGFFDICNARGLTGEQGVIIPKANLQHLMLRKPVIDAVKAGRFHIWAVDHVDQGIEILTGVEAGTRDGDGSWTEGSVNERVSRRLEDLGRQLQTWGRGPEQPELVAPREQMEPEQPPPPKPPEPPRN